MWPSREAPNDSDFRKIHKERAGLAKEKDRLMSPDSPRSEVLAVPEKKMNGSERKVPIAMTTADGALTSAARKMLGLSDGDAILVQEIITRRSRELEGELAKRAMYIVHESNEDAGISAYRIPALLDERIEFLNAIHSDLSNKLGASLAENIYSVFSQDPNNEEKLGGYGKYDVKVKFHPNENGDARIASIVYTDPETGKEVRSGSMTLDTFRERFGDTFEFDGEK